MKRIFNLITFLLLGAGALNAQQILSMTLSPPAPDNTDTVYVYIDLQFPYSGCAGTAYYSQIGNDVTASSLHCMGMLAAICNDVDTIKINPQPVGTYNVYYTLSSGYGGFPCSPGIMPDDSDTLTFNVVSAQSIAEQHELIKSVYPNPTHETCVVEINQGMIGSDLVMYDQTGRIIFTKSISSSSTTLNLNGIADGIYFLQLRVGNGYVGSAAKIIKR